MSNSPSLSQPILTDQELKTIKKGTPMKFKDAYGNSYYGRFTGIHPTENKTYGIYDATLKSENSKYIPQKTHTIWPGDHNMNNVIGVDYYDLNNKPSDFGLQKIEYPVNDDINARPPLFQGDPGGIDYNYADERFEKNRLISNELGARPPLFEGGPWGNQYELAKSRFEAAAAAESSKGGRRKKNKKTKRNKKHQNKTKSKRRKM